jgi:hypothetical protein
LTAVVTSIVTQLCSSGGSRVFKRRSSLMSALAVEVAYDVMASASK